MRICHVCSYFQPEFGYEEYYMAREQAAMGHEVSVVTSDRIFPFNNVEKMLKDIGSPYKDRMRPVGVTKSEGFTTHRLRTNLETLYDFMVISGVPKALAKIRPDVVHAHGLWTWSSYQCAKHRAKLGYRLFVDEHAYATTYDQKPTLKNALLDLEYRSIRAPFARYTIKRADGIIAVSKETVGFLKDFYKVRSPYYIPLGIDHRKFRLNPNVRKRVRKKLGVSKETLILTVGRLEAAKRLELFIEAAKGLDREDVRFLIVGAGNEEYTKKLKAISDERVIFQGFADQNALVGYYSASDIGVWGKAAITIREAMGCALPLVLLDNKDMRSLLKWGNGIAVKPEVKNIEKALKGLMEDPGKMKKMGENGRRAVESELSVEIEAKRLLETYVS